MGTSGAFGGSGGKDWQRARDDVADLVNSPDSTDQQHQVISDLANALDWDATDTTLTPSGEDSSRPPDAPPAQQPFGRLVRPRGAVDGPSGGGGRGGGATTTGTGSGGSGRRSRQRVAGVGGAVLAAGLAVRAGDAGTLNALGLSLPELRELGPVAQCNRILNALVGSGADIDENEMRSASSTALIAVLTEDLSPTAAVRVFIVEYVMEVSLTELGARLRELGTGEISVKIEDDLRSLITAEVDQLALDDARLGPQQLQDALYDALGSARTVLRSLE
jgi:hypothetical protein